MPMFRSRRASMKRRPKVLLSWLSSAAPHSGPRTQGYPQHKGHPQDQRQRSTRDSTAWDIIQGRHVVIGEWIPGITRSGQIPSNQLEREVPAPFLYPRHIAACSCAVPLCSSPFLCTIPISFLRPLPCVRPPSASAPAASSPRDPPPLSPRAPLPARSQPQPEWPPPRPQPRPGWRRRS